MKKILLLSFALFATMQYSKAQVSFSDDFESYVKNTYLGPQSPKWTTWSGTEGGSEDVKVDTVKAHSGTKSLYFKSTDPNGGPADCVLPFQGPYTSGTFSYSMWIFVESTKYGYFNFQGTNTNGAVFTIEAYFQPDNFIYFNGQGINRAKIPYTQGVWQQVKIDIDLNYGLWTISMNGSPAGTFQSPVFSIASLDLYPLNNSSYWVDDVSFSHTPATLPAKNGAVLDYTVLKGTGLVGQTRKSRVVVRNIGTTAITSIDVTYSNNSTQNTQTYSGLNIASLDTHSFVSTTPLALVLGSNKFMAKISNINGAGPDATDKDDTLSKTLTVIQPAAGKMVVSEEATGTWCAWCVRGAVALHEMEKYDGHFQGIAVHNGTTDPMTYKPYDTDLNVTNTAGFPNSMTDRVEWKDPTDIEAEFLKRVVLTPKALLLNGAQYDAANNILKVSIKTTFQQAVTGDYRIACVLVEDSVKGTASGYNQANAYANNANGPMGGYELLPNPVPAAKMQYDHVARLISPQFAGYPNSFPASVSSGASYVHNFTLFLDPSWRKAKMKIVGLLIDPSGKIENASSTTIDKAVTNGYLTGTDVTIGVVKFDAPDQQIQFMPNPVTHNAFVQLMLEKENNVSMEIYSVDGKMLAAKNYGKLSDAQLLQVNTENLTAGLYFVKVNIDGRTSIIKFVKE